MAHVLDFESDVLILEKKIAELRETSSKVGGVNVDSEIRKMQAKVDRILADTYRKLSPWQKVAVARHPDRPKFVDYLKSLFVDFVELSGDRLFGDDTAIMGGVAKYNGRPCVVIGQEKGTDTESRIAHNFGMAKPEGYRKAHRLLSIADQFKLPVITFIDTSGAYPGIESEERGQAESIAKCIEKSFQIKVPFVSIVIGEGGSGGAIALATSDYVLMLEHSVYSVISPEGCASILWKDESKADVAAAIQKLTSSDLLELKITDCVIKEPIGGAHRNKAETIRNTSKALSEFLDKTSILSDSERLSRRRDRFKIIGDIFVEK